MSRRFLVVELWKTRCLINITNYLQWLLVLTYLGILRSSSDRRLGLYGQLFMMTGSSLTSSNGGFVVVKDILVTPMSIKSVLLLSILPPAVLAAGGRMKRLYYVTRRYT